MNTQQAQIKVNIPLPLKDYLESKASKFGMPLAGYLRHLILKDVSDLDYPTYQASTKTEEAYTKAKQEEKTGKLVATDNIDTILDEL